VVWEKGDQLAPGEGLGGTDVVKVVSMVMVWSCEWVL
jgi:hypothetical protein